MSEERTILTSEEAGRLTKQKRDRENLTLRDAADQIGVNASTLSRCENFKHELDADSLAKVAKWLGVPLERLQGDKFIYLEGEPLPQIVDVLIHRDNFLTADAKRTLSTLFRNAYGPLAQHQEGAATN